MDRRKSQQRAGEHEVICVCGGFGFPFGTGSSARIVMVGKALLSAGTAFRVLHCGPSPLPINTEASGVYEGIAFEYTTSLRRPNNAVVRWIAYLRAIINLTLRLGNLRRRGGRVAVWIYILNGPTNLYIGLLCRLLGWPVIQELCEWWPGHPHCSRINKRLYSTPAFFRSATGAIVISNLIGERIKHLMAAANPRLRIYRLPAIVDMDRFLPTDGRRVPPRAGGVPEFVWCGTAEGYRDVLFLIRATGRLIRQGRRLRLVISGASSDESRVMIAACVREQGLPPDALALTGYVDETRFTTLLHSATALLLPMDDIDRSRTRLPNKLGEYLASGRPIVTSEVGDLTRYLSHGITAYLAKPGDEESFADQMAQVLNDPAMADRIGEAGQRVCADHLDYRVHADALAAFFRDCVEDASGVPVIDLA